MPVAAVVFDIGGVLLDWDPRYVYSELIEDPEEMERFLTEVCTMEWNARLDAGASFDEACGDLARLHPDHQALIEAWRRQDDMVRGPIDGSVALLERVSVAGVACHGLTNMPTEVFERRRAQHPFLTLLEGAVVSGEEGVLKPDPEIFRRLVARFELTPAETLFVDDSAVNVGAAAELGFLTHHFRSAEALEADLVARGVLPTAAG